MHNELLQRVALQADTTHADFIPTLCGQVAHWARLTPDALAVTDAYGSLTYRQLLQASHRLELRLREFAAPILPIFLERSTHFVIAALAAMNRGSAYLPLDASTPQQRVRAILEDCDARLMLTHSDSAHALRHAGADLIYVDEFVASSADEPLTRHPTVPTSDQLAYVIYTSGSTGKPKGVEITHANLANLIAWHRETFALTPSDRVSQVAGLSFDAAAWEIWPALAAGASVHFAEDSLRHSPPALRDWLVEQQIAVSFAPTLLAEQLIQLAWPQQTSFRFLLTGADTLHRRPPAGLPFQFINNYGPTECTVVATSGVIEPHGTGKPTIGKPIGDTIALVLDEQLHLVPDGQIGELCLGGSLVGKGYHNLPAQTNARFINWSTGTLALRLYRTGDQVTRLPDGELIFHGRHDDQVKIRGFRIELGEVNAALSRCDGVAAAATIVRDNGGVPELVAYVVPSVTKVLDLHCVSEMLGAQLPDYMLPARLILIGELPVTANGKLDRARLPETSDAAVTSADSSVRSRLSALVAELLGKSEIADDANFFMIGGHSMLGVQLVAKIRDLLGVKLSLRQLFKAPTILALTSEVERAGIAR